MALPEPQPGLVISYTYLWHHEYRAGRDEGVKNRPCVIVLALSKPDAETAVVRVVPVTHSPPDDPSSAFELPAAVKRHLGLDTERSWVMLDEINEFTWPGFDLRPIPPSHDRFAYGFLPPRLFDDLIRRLGQVWRSGQRTPTPAIDRSAQRPLCLTATRSRQIHETFGSAEHGTREINGRASWTWA